VALHPLAINVVGEGLVYRPHRDAIISGGKPLHLAGLETFTTLDRDGNVSAVSWILHHDYIGSLSKGTLVNGWRFRSGNIQVGDNALLEDLFPESRFNGWTIAESHVVDQKIVPNGRRDNYEHSAHFGDLLTRLVPYAREIAHLCRNSSIARNAIQKLSTDLDKCEEKLAIASKPRTPSFVSAGLKNEIESLLPAMNKAAEKPLFDIPAGEELRTRLRKVVTRTEQIGSTSEKADALSDFPAPQRGIIKQIIEAIHVIEGESQDADRLVGKILSRLRKQRTAKMIR
jgi:hypothetical protein